MHIRYKYETIFALTLIMNCHKIKD